jgi:hypothetical protein
MEASHITVRGENVDRLAGTLIEDKATESKQSINKRGVRNIHKYEGDGVTQLAYERGAAYEDSWLMVSILVERIDDRTARVSVLVGGGGRGPFKLEEISMRRLLRGEGSVGEAGRFGTVLEDVKRACESLDLEIITQWETDTESSMSAKIERKIFES